MERLGDEGTLSVGVANPRASLAAGLVERHGMRMLQIARRFSQSPADAEDAYQRALEKLLTKAPTDDEERLVGWLITVVRNEALTIGRRDASRATESLEDVAPTTAADEGDPGDLALEREHFAHGREALQRMHPDQVRCLLLRADGLDYPEICDITGFSYAKVNRCLTDGRKAFSIGVRAIDSGWECERMLPMLSRLADGVVDDDVKRELRGHLKHCGNCRATVREFRVAPKRVAAVFPVGITALASLRDTLTRASDAVGGSLSSLQERLAGGIGNVQHGSELAFAKKAAVVALVSASLVTGGAAVHKAVLDDQGDVGSVPPVTTVLPDPTGATSASPPTEASTTQPQTQEHPAKPRDVRQSDVAGPDRLAAQPAPDSVASAPGGSIGDSAGFSSPPQSAAGGGSASSPQPNQPADLAP